ncbi:MAG: flavin reductase family protein [Flavobacteriales bacterium]
MKTIIPSETPLALLHQYLLGAVGPRPVALASTIDEQGRPNLAPFSFFNVFSVNPPVAIFSPARRGRDNTTKHTYENVIQVKECVINIVNYDMVHQTSLSSTEYPEGVNEFVKSGLTPVASIKVKPARVKESHIQMECTVREVISLGNNGGAGQLVVCEVVCMHIAEHVLDADGRIAPEKMDQVARMGGHWYTRAKMGLFQLPQPTTNIGIGIDMIPADIRNSEVLSGNNLGLLGSIESLPDETAVNEYKLTELADIFIENEKDATLLQRILHQHARKLLEQGKLIEAWQTLLAYNG